jgi:hypothetical protein
MPYGFPFRGGGHGWLGGGSDRQWFGGDGGHQWQSGSSPCGGGCMGPGGGDGYCVQGQFAPLPSPNPSLSPCPIYTGPPPNPPLTSPFECPMLPPD